MMPYDIITILMRAARSNAAAGGRHARAAISGNAQEAHVVHRARKQV